MKIYFNKELFFSNFTRPLIIAEISGNHSGSKDNLIKAILSAKKNGADLVKIQTYEAEDLVLKDSKNFSFKTGIWKNQNLWNLYKKAETPLEWHFDLFKIAKKHKINLFSTPFSNRAVDLLEKCKVNIYKISSFELTDVKLINRVAITKKPIILSTGCCNIDELKNTIKIINRYHNKIIIMHCESGYPTKIVNANIKKIEYLRKKFKNNLIGLSDHTKTISSSLAASAIGVSCIEKHYNFKKHRTVDSEFSIGAKDLRQLRDMSEEIFLSTKKNPNFMKEKKDSMLKRSIYVIKNIKKGEKFNFDNISTFRPKKGLCSSKFFKIIGKKSRRNLTKNLPLKMSDVVNLKNKILKI